MKKELHTLLVRIQDTYWAKLHYWVGSLGLEDIHLCQIFLWTELVTLFVLVWVFQKTDTERRLWVEVISLGGDSKEHPRTVGKWGKKEKTATRGMLSRKAPGYLGNTVDYTGKSNPLQCGGADLSHTATYKWLIKGSSQEVFILRCFQTALEG